MDRSSSEDSAKNTKARLLTAAEQLYTQAGPESLSLRDLTELAGVNLAAVNYHFGSKNALVCAMIARRLDPMNEQRLAELARLEKSMREKLRCEHIITALMKPLVHDGFDIVDSPENCNFAIRSSSDLSQPLRQFLTQRYALVEQNYMAAFCRVTPWLTDEEVTWQLNCLAFALPGIAINTSTVQLLRKAMVEHSASKTALLTRLAETVATLLKAPPPESDYQSMIDVVFLENHAVAA